MTGITWFLLNREPYWGSSSENLSVKGLRRCTILCSLKTFNRLIAFTEISGIARGDYLARAFLLSKKREGSGSAQVGTILYC
jgi:hypothetical protein